MLSGHATAQGTASYSKRFAASLAPAHFRDSVDHLQLSSIGLVTSWIQLSTTVTNAVNA